MRMSATEPMRPAGSARTSLLQVLIPSALLTLGAMR